MSTMTCHCGKQFELPEKLEGRRVNCPQCNSVIFLSAEQAAGSKQSDSGGYDLSSAAKEDEKKRIAGVEGIPDWLDEYRESEEIKKAERDKTMALIERLGAVNAALDPLGAALYTAATHADAETSIAALTTVAMTTHPVYAPVATAFLEFIGPSDAAGAGEVLALLKEARDSRAEQTILKVLHKLGPTPVVQVRSLIELLKSKHAALHAWAVQCLKRIGSPAKRAVPALLESLKINNSHGMRLSVIDALGAIAREGEQVIPILLQAVKHQSADYRAHGATALGKFGAGASKTVGSLKELEKDAEEGVRQAAEEALRAIAAAMKGAGSTAAPAAGAGNGPVAEPIIVPCSCGKKLRIKAELGGKKVKCPACAGVVAVPMPRPSAVVAAAPAASAAAAVAERECPTCLATVPGTAVLCVHCGHDFRVKARQGAEQAATG